MSLPGVRMLYFNGRFVSEEEAKISVFEPGFLFGLGIFETMRAYNNKIVYLKQHLGRLRRSCRLINIKLLYLDAQLEKIVERLIQANGFKDAYVRLTVWEGCDGSNIMAFAKKYKPPVLNEYRRGFSACVCPFRHAENSFLTRLKTNNRLFYELGWRLAKTSGFHEAIILNSRGYLAEGTRSNIFLVKDNEMFTPALACGCLDGITRRVIFDLAKDYNLKAYEGNFTLRDLREADEAFFTNSLAGVMPLVSLERRRISLGEAGRLTKFFLKKYNALLKDCS